MKCFAKFFFFLLASPLLAQTSTGPPLNLVLPDPNSTNWNVPLNNNFITINSLYSLVTANGYLYADQCAGADIGAKINTCVAALPTATSGYKVGTIILPNTSTEPSLKTWSTTVHVGPGVSFIGQGQLASYFTCSVVGDCLLHDESASSGLYAHTVSINSVFQGFAITGINTVVQNIIHLKDAVNVTFRDVGVDGAGAAGSACIWLHD